MIAVISFISLFSIVNVRAASVKDNGERMDSKKAQAIISVQAKKVLESIKNLDLNALAKVVHPKKGLRFSPYSMVVPKEDKLFKADQINSLLKDSKKYEWGAYDDSAEPILLTFADYYKKFIYDRDYAKAPKVGYNKKIGYGNTLNNSFEMYPNSIIVEYNFPGSEGMDWSSLKLAFEEYKGQWYLVGIIHDCWTI